MNIPFLTVTFFLSIGSLLSAQSPIYRDSLIQQVTDELTILSGKELAGRGYTREGHTRAAKYIANRYQQIGLKRVGGEDYYQRFPLKINLATQATLWINGDRLEIGVDFIANKFSGTGEVAGKLYDADYGLKPNSKAAGKVLLFRTGWPVDIANDAEKQKAYSDLKSLPNRIAAWAKHSPLAIIVVQQKLTAGFTREAAPFPILEVRADALPNKPKKAKLSCDSKLTRLTTQNVIGMIPGQEVPDTAIIICAHYDHLGQVGSAVFAGANDNGAGVAMLISMAEHFAMHQDQLKYSLIFIAFGGEETGLVGSNYYVNQESRFPLSQTQFVLNLDLMSNGDEGIMAVGGKDYTTQFDQLVALNDSLELVPVVRARPNAPNSDHYFFLKNGVPGFFIYTMGGPPHYHDVNDVLSNQVFSRYAEVRYLLIKFLEQMVMQ